MQVVRRIDFLCPGRCSPADQSFIQSVTVQQCLDLAQPVRSMACADYSDMGVAERAAVVLVVEQENAGEGEVALAPREFAEGPAPICGPVRQVQFHDDLVRS